MGPFDEFKAVKIAYIAAGAGGMYCGSCLRDNTLAVALNALGHSTVLVPTYTPLRTDEENASLPRVFYGGIGVYLAEKFPFLRRRMPLVDRFLALPGLLHIVSFFAGSTEARSLGDLTVSVLRGEDGHQKKSLDELVEYLEKELHPDVVHLSNSLLSGLAAALRRRLRVPVVCTFQGEDLFLDGLPPVHREEALGLIRRAAEEIAAFTAVSRFAGDRMAALIGLPAARVKVIPPGLRLEGFPPPAEGRPRDPRPPFTVGYLARIAPEKGLSILGEAFRIFRAAVDRETGAPGTGATAPPPILRAAGYIGLSGRRYLAGIERQMEAWGLARSFIYEGEMDRAEKIRFLMGADVLSVPTPYPESMGLFAFEALACGVPLVLPRSGSFPEIIEATGGGILVPPNDPAALAEGLLEVWRDSEKARSLGRRGAEVVHGRFHAAAMAQATADLYTQLCSAPSR